MASSLQRRVDPPIATADAPVLRVEPDGPRASEEAIRLALHVRDTRSAGEGRVLMFVPICASGDAVPLVDDVVRGLVELNEGPAIVVDLRVSQTRRLPRRWAELPGDGDAISGAWHSGVESAGRAHPFAGRHDTVSHAASPEFAAFFAHARARYSYVLCVANPPASSVETLIAAGLCDGVVLSVSPRRTTRAEVQRAADQLRRAHAHVIGFVVDGRAQKGA